MSAAMSALEEEEAEKLALSQEEEEIRVLEKVVIESEKRLQRNQKLGRGVDAEACNGIRRGRTTLALCAKDEEKARFHLKAAWAADYARLEPYLALAKRTKSSDDAARVGDLALESLAYFGPLVSQVSGRGRHQLMTTCGDLERYRSTIAKCSDDALAERWYLRSALTLPTDGRAFGLMAMVAGHRGNSPAATHWSYRADLADKRWDGAKQTFSFHGERCKRKSDESSDLSFEWHAAAALVLAKTKVSGAGGLLATAKRRFENAIAALPKPQTQRRRGNKGHENDPGLSGIIPSRLEALRWTLTTIFARLAAEQHGETGVADEATTALMKLLAFCCQVDSTSAVLAGARYIAVLPEFPSHDDRLAAGLARAANRSLERAGTARAVALDDDAYCAGLYDAPADVDDFIDDDAQRNARLRDVAVLLCDRHRFLRRRSDGTFEAIGTEPTSSRRRRSSRRRKAVDEDEEEEPAAHDEVDDDDDQDDDDDDEDSGGEVPSGASASSETEESDDDSDSDEATLFVVDAANVAMRHGRRGASATFSTRGIRLCVEYLERKYRRCRFAMFLPEYVLSPKIVAANSRRRDRARLTTTDLNDVTKKIPDDLPYLVDLQRKGILHATPSHDYDDSYQLDYARRHNGIIVSNDRFRDAISNAAPDQRNDLTTFLDTRLLSFAFVEDEFVPNPDFRLPFRLKQTRTPTTTTTTQKQQSRRRRRIGA